MRAFIVTVAGKSTRFNQGYENPVLKCLYHTKETSECILYRLLRQAARAGYDQLIVVGGYRYQDLRCAISRYVASNGHFVELVYNPRWEDSGSMYSLYCGVEAAAGASEILFCEGDIITDDKSFQKICMTAKDSFAVALEPIYSDRAVVAYQSPDDRLHYLYNTQHGTLAFPTDVKAIFNSAQVWSIKDTKVFFELNRHLTESERCGTNLMLLGKYFGRLPWNELEPVIFRHWINCNTREDFGYYEQSKGLFDNLDAIKIGGEPVNDS